MVDRNGDLEHRNTHPLLRHKGPGQVPIYTPPAVPILGSHNDRAQPIAHGGIIDDRPDPSPSGTAGHRLPARQTGEVCMSRGQANTTGTAWMRRGGGGSQQKHGGKGPNTPGLTRCGVAGAPMASEVTSSLPAFDLGTKNDTADPRLDMRDFCRQLQIVSNISSGCAAVLWGRQRLSPYIQQFTFHALRIFIWGSYKPLGASCLNEDLATCPVLRCRIQTVVMTD